jgi:hypothetical protein
MSAAPHRLSALAAFLLVVCCAFAARAEEDGIKVGEGRLHVYLALEGRYDTFATVNAAGMTVPDFSLSIEPGFNLNVPGNTVALQLDAEIQQLLYVNSDGLDRLLANVNLLIDFLKGGPFELKLADVFIRANNTQLSVLPYAIISDYNDASLVTPIRPGGGALVLEPGYHFIYNHFEPYPGPVPTDCQPAASPGCNPLNAGFLDYYLQRVLLDVRLKFLPKTQAILSGEFDSMSYINQGSTPDQANSNAPLDLMSVTVGAAGLITANIEAAFKVGYAQTFILSEAFQAIPALVQAGNQQTVVGQALIGYLIGDTGSIRLGFNRSLQAVPTALSYSTTNQLYLSSKILLAGRWTLHANVGYALINYPLNVEATGPRTDQIFTIDLGPEYEVTRWFRVALDYNLSSVGSDDPAFNVYANATPIFGPLGYTDNQFYVKFTFIY